MKKIITTAILPEHKGYMKEKEDVIKSSDFPKGDKFTVKELRSKIKRIQEFRKEKIEN